MKAKLIKYGYRSLLYVKKYSPELLLGAGLLSGAAAIVTSCRSTLKYQDVLEEHDATVGQIKHTASINFKYEEEDMDDDLRNAKGILVKDTIKTYALPATFTVASAGCILASFNILKGRYVAAVAAYKVLHSTFERYRDRVIEDHGEQVDYNYLNNIRTKKVTGKDENGKDVTVTVKDINNKYADIFDKSCSNWSPRNEYNEVFLISQEAHANRMLDVRGHIFLNEVRDLLGMKRIPEGQYIGWVKGEGMQNYVDFGLTQDAWIAPDPLNGKAAKVIINFNCDGHIYDLI